MISTFFSTDQLASPQAFITALAVGLAFGFVLERAGFGSSRRLAGIFYLRDMTVLKVMFTAVITAMLGLSFVLGMGWLSMDSIYMMPTIYGAQIVGGLLFGVGFVMSGWCPGTAAVGVASGKIDGLVFLGGAVLGSVLFNETFPWLGWLKNWGYQEETLLAFGLSPTTFGVLLTLVAVGAFYFAEWVESRRGDGGHLQSPILKSLSITMVVLAFAMLVLPSGAISSSGPNLYATSGERAATELLGQIEQAEDHIDPEVLADRLMAGEEDLLVVDVRPPDEYEAFHIRGAVNLPLAELATRLQPYRGQATIVLYSTGMTHPAQARDILARLGYENVFMLTDGLAGFVDRCLKPVSLRDEVLSPQEVAKVAAWRRYFSGDTPATASVVPTPEAAVGELPTRMVSTDWLRNRLGAPKLRMIDVREQALYSTSHIPGSVRIDVESFRSTVDGIPSVLLPADVLAAHLGLMGISEQDTVVIIADVKFRDATLVAMGLERVGHRDWAILEGGFDAWGAAGNPVEAALTRAPETQYHPTPDADKFTVTADEVAAMLNDPTTVILDSRPQDYYLGESQDEARAGHIPGAVSVPYKEDLTESGQLRPVAELETKYAEIIPSKSTHVVVHCRTGHQASQTYFVLKHLLGYGNVQWYDGGWTDWAARPDLPAVVGADGLTASVR